MLSAAHRLSLLASERTRHFVFAIGSSFIQKSVGLVTVVFQFPLLLGALGTTRFGIYALVTSGLAWLAIVATTFAPGLAREVALAVAKRDQAVEGRLFSATAKWSLLVLVFLTLAGATIATVGYVRSDIGVEMVKPLIVASVLLPIFFGCMIFDAVLAGYQRQYIVNFTTTAGSIVNTVALLALQGREPSVGACILAVYGPLIVAKAVNILILLRLRPYLLRYARTANARDVLNLTIVSLPFLALYGGLLTIQCLPTVIVGILLGPDAAAEYAIVFRYAAMVVSITIAINQGLLPAMVDATSVQDLLWMKRAKRWVVFGCLAIACMFALAGISAITWILRAWAHFELADLILGQLISAYIALWAWQELNVTLLISAGVVWRTAATVLGEALLAIVLATLLLPRFGVTGAGLALVVASTCLSAWILPLFRSRLENRALGSAMGS